MQAGQKTGGKAAGGLDKGQERAVMGRKTKSGTVLGWRAIARTSVISITLECGGQKRQFSYRPNTSDEHVVQQMFSAQHYDLKKLKRNPDILSFLQGKLLGGERPLIVDVGANIGASSVFFAMVYPEARVVAVEPEPANYALLCANVEGLGVRCLQAAAASHPGRTRLLDPGIGPWGYRTEPSGPGVEVPQITLSQIFQEHGGPPYYPYLVKIDIEGGEKDLFEADLDWVKNTPVVIIELHDWIMPRQGTALPFLRCVSALDRDFVIFGENVFSIDNRLVCKS
jgi:FkbM family methyltransferase